MAATPTLYAGRRACPGRIIVAMSSALSAASSSRRDDASLLERGHELASLAGLVTAARDGEGPIGLIEGPAGIGKTRLLAEGRRCAEEEGFQVLAARGSELEREFLFGVVRQLFEPVLIDPEAHANLLSGAAAPAEPGSHRRAIPPGPPRAAMHPSRHSTASIGCRST